MTYVYYIKKYMFNIYNATSEKFKFWSISYDQN